jgi:hypothetical protein
VRQINRMTLQNFVDYNLPEGWYLSSARIRCAAAAA